VERHELELRILYVTGDLNDKANKGCWIWYAVVLLEGEAPANPEQLTKSFYTKRKKDVMDFDYPDSRKTPWFAIENEGKKDLSADKDLSQENKQSIGVILTEITRFTITSLCPFQN
jgi:hypothetical protein